MAIPWYVRIVKNRIVLSTSSKTTALWSLASAKLEYAGKVGVDGIVANFAT
jgi:hypothetical protein